MKITVAKGDFLCYGILNGDGKLNGSIFQDRNELIHGGSEMKCSKFCAGGMNTPIGMRAINVDREVIQELHLCREKDGKFKCLLGCTDYPTSQDAAQNILRNSGLGTICRLNPFI